VALWQQRDNRDRPEHASLFVPDICRDRTGHHPIGVSRLSRVPLGWKERPASNRRRARREKSLVAAAPLAPRACDRNINKGVCPTQERPRTIMRLHASRPGLRARSIVGLRLKRLLLQTVRNTYTRHVIRALETRKKHMVKLRLATCIC
jgi:hypothetical protein